MVDTTVEIGGLKLSTPFLIGSGARHGEAERIKDYVKHMKENHWAGLVTKSYGRTKFEKFTFADQEKPYLWTTDAFHRIALQNRGPEIGTMSKENMRELAESVKIAHEHGLVIIGNISRNPTLDEWRAGAELMTGSGVDAIEVNMGCPAYRAKMLEEMAEDTGAEFPLVGYLCGKNLEAAVSVISAVCESTDLPVFAKLPSVADVEVAEACKKAGATGLTLINTVGGLVGINIETTVPISSTTHGRGFVSGLSGPIIRPIGLSVVAEVASLVDAPIFGVGGIAKWQDAVEYIMVGASAVQVCTAVMWKGFQLGKTMYEGLTDFMEHHGYKSIADFQGASLKHLYLQTPAQDINVVARIDSEVCNQCGLCYVACNESSYDAIIKRDGSFVVDITKCDGCGLCKVVCPVTGAVIFEDAT